MNKAVLFKISLLLILAIAVFFFDTKVDKEFISTLYTVVGIMFSVGMGLIVSSSFDNVKNKEALHFLRVRLDKVKIRFIVFFALSTICFVMFSYTPGLLFENSLTKVNLHLLFCAVLLVSIWYFTVNFLAIQKLKNDITDIILKEGYK